MDGRCVGVTDTHSGILSVHAAHAGAGSVRCCRGPRGALALPPHLASTSDHTDDATQQTAVSELDLFQLTNAPRPPPDPLYFGDYPPPMRQALGALLPAFTPAESALLKGSIDYFAVQFYCECAMHLFAQGINTMCMRKYCSLRA